jgi:hypothetical protein
MAARAATAAFGLAVGAGQPLGDLIAAAPVVTRNARQNGFRKRSAGAGRDRDEAQRDHARSPTGYRLRIRFHDASHPSRIATIMLGRTAVKVLRRPEKSPEKF